MILPMMNAVTWPSYVRQRRRRTGACRSTVTLVAVDDLGDVIVQDDDLFGEGVNVAARLERLSEPGGICLTR